MQLNINNRIALITGASQGIGRAIAIQLAKEGAHIAITSKDEKNLAQVAQEIKQFNSNVIYVPGDANSSDDINSIIKEVIKHFGNIDILVNNVGIIGRVAAFEELEDHEWQALFNLNVMSGIRFTHAVLSHMKQKQWGRIIFMSSERAIEPRSEMPHYAMTKAAILSVTKSLANVLGKYNITVNSIAPGVIPTPAFDADAKKLGVTREILAAQFCRNVMSENSLGTPEDVAMMVCYLCSEAARWITGSNFRIDGGAIGCVQN